MLGSVELATLEGPRSETPAEVSENHQCVCWVFGIFCRKLASKNQCSIGAVIIRLEDPNRNLLPRAFPKGPEACGGVLRAPILCAGLEASQKDTTKFGSGSLFLHIPILTHPKPDPFSGLRPKKSVDHGNQQEVRTTLWPTTQPRTKPQENLRPRRPSPRRFASLPQSQTHNSMVAFSHPLRNQRPTLPLFFSPCTRPACVHAVFRPHSPLVHLAWMLGL